MLNNCTMNKPFTRVAVCVKWKISGVCKIERHTRSLLEVNMYKRKCLGALRTVAIRNSEVGRYSGGVNVQYEWQKNPCQR